MSPVILFDGVCNLCNGFVQFVIQRDADARFSFAPLQSPIADRLIGQPSPAARDPESLVLVEDGRISVRSTAALRIARGLSSPWRILYLLIAVPRPIRDWAYDVVARHRYGWFGRRASCMVPTEEVRSRFLDESAVDSQKLGQLR